MSSGAPVEHESTNNESTPPQSSQVPTSLVISTQTPILPEHIYMGSSVEDEMIDSIDTIIRLHLTRPNHQSPYGYNFHWTVDEEPSLNYSVTLTIREPS